MTQLSKHFTLAELIRSDTATEKGIDNTPDVQHLANLHKLASCLEEIRTLLGKPMVITSGYRSPALNKAIEGSSATSSHCDGLAADFHCYGYGTDMDVCKVIAASAIQFDQLIYEQSARGSTWIHVGIGAKMRRDVISWRSGRGYRNGITRI